MRANLEVTRGQIYAESVSMALAKKVGHGAAHKLVERACRKALEEGRHLREVVAGDGEISEHLPAAEVAGLFEPGRHVRAAARLVDQALAAASKVVSTSSEGMPCPLQK
jgi:3-carboxy-cis,cis-muconate cycloisomerase